MKVNIGIIGFGWMAYYHYKYIIPKNGDFNVVAIYDIDKAKKSVAEQFNIKSYDNLDMFLNDDNFSTVLVATPNDSHKELVIKSFEKGKNVICEKPVALNANDVKEMIDASIKYNKIFTVHHNRRRDRDFLSVKEVLDNNTLGKPFLIESRVDGANGIPSDWRREKVHGGGMLYDWGPHLIDQILLLVDSKVVEIYAQLITLKYEVDDNIRIQLKFENGVCAQVEILTNCLIPLPRWHVLCANGTLNIDNFKNDGKMICGTLKEIDWTLESADNYAGSTRTMRARPENTIKEMEIPKKETDWFEFYFNYQRVLEDKEELLVKPQEILRLTQIIDLISESSKLGKSISCCI